MFAVAVTIVANDARRLTELSCRIEGMVGSLRATGFLGDVVCLAHGLVAEHEVLARVCTERLVAKDLPAYDAGPNDANTSTTIEFYKRHGRMPPPAEATIQQRDDGAATSLKFLSWTLTRYAMVMHADLDVLFLESPQPALEAAVRQGLVFQAASTERGKRGGYDGLNTHMLLLRPSLEIFAILAANAANGHFVPYTRTEQDVLEGILTRSVGLAAGGANASELLRAPGSQLYTSPNVRLPAHLHYFGHGCGSRYCCGKAPHVMRIPRQACQRSAHRAPALIVSRVLDVIYAPRADVVPPEVRSDDGSGRRLKARDRANKPKRASLSATALEGARAGATSSADEPHGGDNQSGLSSTRYRVEWLSAAALGSRETKVVSLDELCGGARELIERCHAHHWIGASTPEAESREAVRHKAASRRKFLALQEASGERMGCGAE